MAEDKTVKKQNTAEDNKKINSGGEGQPLEQNAAPSNNETENKFANIEEEIFEDNNGRHYIKIGLFEALAKYTSAGPAGFGNLNMGALGDISEIMNIPTPKLKRPGVLERACYVAKFLAANLPNWTVMHGSAWAGVFIDENGCEAGEGSVMQAEKAGKSTNKFATGPNAYGAGFASWTGTTKFDALRSAGYPTDFKIETLSLEQQCEVLKAQCLYGSYGKHGFTAAMAAATNFLDASARAFFATHGLGHSGKSRYADIVWADAIAEDARIPGRLMRAMNRSTPSPNWSGLPQRRAAYGLAVYKACGGVV